MTPLEKRLTIALAAVLGLLLVLSAIVVIGIQQQKFADAKADQKINDEKEKREAAEKERDQERAETKARIEALEKKTREPATAAEVAAILAPYMSKNTQPIIVQPPATTAAPGEKPVPPSAPGLLYQGQALTDLRNREVKCEQTEINCADLAKEVVKLKGDKQSLQESLDASEKARKKSKWRRVGENAMKVGIFAAGVGIGRATK